MKHILFVDDEKYLLDGMKRSLRAYRKEWKMTFCESGAEALEALEKTPADVVISDMRMPGMDGATLLAKVREQFPGTIRMVLTGHTELEAALRAIPIAHNFLSKPCEGKVIKEVIDRALRLQDILEDKELLKLIDSMDGLPAAPSTYAELSNMLRSEEASIDGVTRVIERDAAIASRVLRTVNSGFFGRSNRVSDVKSAINFLGFKIIQTLVLSVEVFQNNSLKSLSKHYDIEEEQQHALYVAKISSSLMPDVVDPDQAFMAGLLHDVGKLVLASELPEKFAEIIQLTKERDIPLYLAEQETNIFTHAEFGAYLPNLWGLPDHITEAVAYHHKPWEIEDQEAFNLASAVYVANNLAHKFSDKKKLTGLYEPINESYLEGLGVLNLLPSWEEQAEEIGFEETATV